MIDQRPARRHEAPVLRRDARRDLDRGMLARRLRAPGRSRCPGCTFARMCYEQWPSSCVSATPIVERPPALDLGDARGRARGSARRPAMARRRLLLPALRHWLDDARAAIRTRFEADNDAEAVVSGRCRLIDALFQGLLDLALAKVFRLANPTAGERLAVVAVGGYGRGELAPYSDVDLLFLHPYKRTAHTEQMIEFLLYRLWDLGLKVGQATRSIDDCLRTRPRRPRRSARVCSRRASCGATPVCSTSFASASRARRSTAAARPFVEAKLAERDARHQRTGDSRYLLEPNVKEGKGGLRDLQTLFWLGRFLYRHRASRRSWSSMACWTPGRCATSPRPAAVPLGRALPSALPDRSAGGAPDLRPAARDRAPHGLSRPRRVEQRRALHEALLPGRQGGRRADPDLLRRARGAAPAPRRASGWPDSASAAGGSTA